MLGIARIVGRRLGVKLDPDDLRDKGIRAAKKYLEGLCGVVFPAGGAPPGKSAALQSPAQCYRPQSWACQATEE